MQALSNYQMYSIAKLHYHTKAVFGGCFTADTLPCYITKYPSFYICNSSMSWEGGSHWILLLYQAPNVESEYFDPRGRSVSDYHRLVEENLIVNGNGRYKVNSVAYQPPNSQTCGHFCLWFADKRCQNIPYHTCLNMLNPDNLKENEDYVSSYVMQHMTPG